jgi:hypothetical protein
MPHDDPVDHHSNHLRILGLVAGIDEFKGAWRALGTLAPARLSALLRVAEPTKLNVLDPQVYKQFVENESFKRFVGDIEFAITSP